MPSPHAVEQFLKLASRIKTAEEDGQDLLEYGLLAALIAILAIGAVATVGQTILNVFWKTIAGTAF